MKLGLYFRLFIFVATITLLVALIGWIAHTSWRRTGDLHEQLSAKEWQSSQISDRLQKAILGLNNLMLRYAAYRSEADWTNFSSASKDLARWLNQQQPILSSQKEQPFLDLINIAYNDYLTAAAALNQRIYGTRQTSIRLVEFTDLEKQSKRVLDLSLQLTEAHRTSMELLREQNLHSLNILRFELLGTLVILVIAGCWLAVVVYRELIAPLRVQLVESRQLVERQEKLASLGMLAAGVAHEIRNPLTAIKAWLFLQQKHLKPDSPEFEEAEVIGSEINRLDRILRDFLQFAKPAEPQMTVVATEQPLREVQTLMQPQLDKLGIKLAVEAVAPGQIRVDPHQIKQVLINLIQNAADSIGENGTVTLRARCAEKRLNDRQMPVIILEVSDTGKGIPEGVEKRLFDPFFTTKDFGTGLGLPIAARLVEKQQGALQYQTRSGGGTTFGIILPLHTA